MAPLGNDLREDETCRTFVLPALKVTAGSDDERIRRELGSCSTTELLYDIA